VNLAGSNPVSGASHPADSARIRVGAVSYLNTKPLVYGLAERAVEVDLEYDLPSRLADRLNGGELDIALIPSIEYFRHPGYTIVSNACIGCRGPVLSVKLLSRRPMAQIRTLALDEGSRSSAVLARILLKARFGLSPRLQILPHAADVTQATTDAVLLIGDRAIHPPVDVYRECWDLGDQWCRWSELPFVFAMWVARPGVDASGLEVELAAARDAGVANLESIAKLEAPHVGLTYERTLQYLRDNLYFYLGTRERRGLDRFHRCAAELGEAPKPKEESIYDLQAS
jgi:chorismate dehydratase